MFETILRINTKNKTRYQIHQEIAGLLQGTERDYLYEVSNDFDDACDDSSIYVRSNRHRDGWFAMELPKAGKTYTVLGTLYFDRSPSRHKARFDDMREFHSSLNPRGWLASSKLTERVNAILTSCGAVSDLDCWAMRGIELGKPGMGRVIMTPITFECHVTVTDEAAAYKLIQHGAGRGRAFGFGVLHFIDDGDDE